MISCLVLVLLLLQLEPLRGGHSEEAAGGAPTGPAAHSQASPVATGPRAARSTSAPAHAAGACSYPFPRYGSGSASAG